MSLDEYVADQGREHSQHHARHLEVVVHILSALERLIEFEHQRAQYYLQGILAAVVDEHNHLEVVVPVTDEIKERDSGNDGNREWEQPSLLIKYRLYNASHYRGEFCSPRFV